MCDNFLYVFKGTPSGRARLSGPGHVQTWKRECIERIARSGVRTMPQAGGVAGTAPTPGGRPAAPCRAGALRARRRHQVSTPAPAGRQSPPQRTPMTATTRTDGTVLLRRAFSRRAKITFKGAPACGLRVGCSATADP
jgi:hypothetical protein